MIAARFTSIDLRLQDSTNSGSEFLSGSLGLLWLPAMDEDLPPPVRKNTNKKLKDTDPVYIVIKAPGA